MSYCAVGEVLFAAKGGSDISGGCGTGVVVSALDGHCCSEDSWSNTNYILLKGALSYRHRCEQKVRQALALMAPQQLETIKWKAQAGSSKAIGIEPGLAERVAKATQRFEVLYPEARWYRVDDAAGKDHKCGPFNVWQARETVQTAERKAAQDAIYVNLSADDKKTVEPWGMDIGRGVIFTVPGSAMLAHVGTIPAQEQLVAVEGSTVTAVGYGRKLIDALAPVLKTSSIATAAKRVYASPSSAPSIRSIDKQELMAATDQGQASGVPWLWVGLGAVALAAAGGGYWYYQTRG